MLLLRFDSLCHVGSTGGAHLASRVVDVRVHVARLGTHVAHVCPVHPVHATGARTRVGRGQSCRCESTLPTRAHTTVTIEIPVQAHQIGVLCYPRVQGVPRSEHRPRGGGRGDWGVSMSWVWNRAWRALDCCSCLGPGSSATPWTRMRTVFCFLMYSWKKLCCILGGVHTKKCGLLVRHPSVLVKMSIEGCVAKSRLDVFQSFSWAVLRDSNR